MKKGMISVGIAAMAIIVGVCCYVVGNLKPSNNLIQNPEPVISVTDASDLWLEFLKLENNEKNMVYSPLSITYALKMLAEGASGETKEQIDELIKNVNLSKYESIDKVLSMANAVYVRDTYEEYVKEGYKNSVVEKYDAEIKSDPFAGPENINKWIEEKTFGIIKNMLDENLFRSSFFKMILINALAIEMDWETEFVNGKTRGAEFVKADGEKIIATTMSKVDTTSAAAFYKGEDVTVLSMDLKEYDDTQFEFLAIMPEQEALDTYIEDITMEDIEALDSKLILASDKKVKDGLEINIPKFKYEYNLKLKEDLIKLGMTRAFDANGAEFDNMAETELYVTDALHKANIDFSEKGIKAAAVTVIVMFENVVSIEAVPEYMVVKLDKPFLFLIRDKETKEVWFVGTMYEPNLWEVDMAEYYGG